VISGTSTGGLVTAMLATPNEQNRPLFAAKTLMTSTLRTALKSFTRTGNNPGYECHNKELNIVYQVL